MKDNICLAHNAEFDCNYLNVFAYDLNSYAHSEGYSHINIEPPKVTHFFDTMGEIFPLLIKQVPEYKNVSFAKSNLDYVA